MALQLGDIAPDFTSESTEGKLSLYDWKGESWLILMSHPKDFTPVCTTELGCLAKLKEEFSKRNCKVLALSVDPLADHHSWIKDINRTQSTTVNFPLLADPEKKIATLYGMIHPKADNTFTVRSVFIIGPDNKIKLTLTYPASTGRNFHEILRALDSLQLTENHSVATPVNWKWGEDCVVLPTIPTEELAEKFPAGCEIVTSYLRTTPQPGKKVPN